MYVRMRFLLPAAAALVLTGAAAISFARGAEVKAGDIAITAAWARATPPAAKVAAAYVRVENRGDAADRLLSAATPAAQSVTAHETVEENGVASMRPLADAAIPPGGTLDMSPGGIHLMLTGLAAPLTQGEHVPLTLVFEKAGAVTVTLDVAPIGADMPMDAHHTM
jgi:copper(I)-binding protein